MFNPFFIVAAIITVIGMIDEAGKKKKSPETPPPKPAVKTISDPKTGPAVIVNVGEKSVQSESKKPKSKPPVKVPNEPLGDG